MHNEKIALIKPPIYPKRWGLQGISSLKKQANSIALGTKGQVHNLLIYFFVTHYKRVAPLDSY